MVEYSGGGLDGLIREDSSEGVAVFGSEAWEGHTMDALTLKLSPRSVMGKKVKRLRREGIVPVHLFGRGTRSQALQADAGVLRRILPRAGSNVPITVEVEDQEGESICFVREVQWHPVTDHLLHVDFLRVDVSRAVTAEVPIVLEGASLAVDEMGGTLIQALNTIRVESLPMSMPVSFKVDISNLDNFDKTIRVSMLEVGPEVTILTDPEEMIATVVPPRIEEEEVAEELEVAEGLEEGVEEAGTETARPQAEEG
jgi:large subunit ribosomal protein L25